MRRRIEALADRFEEFVSEDDHDCLLITCSDDGVGLVGAAVDLMEQRGSIDLSFLWLEPWTSFGHFAATMVSRIDAFLAEAGLRAAPERSDAGLEGRLTHLASVLRTRGDVRVVLWVCPSAIADAGSYASALATLVSVVVRPGIKVGLRDHPARLRPFFARRSLRTLEVALDTSEAAQRAAMWEEARDPASPTDVRLCALVSAAMTDAAHGCAEQSLVTLTELAQGLAENGQLGGTAVTLVCVASVLAQLSRLDEARTCIARGLELAASASVLGVLPSGGMLAGHLAMQAGDAADADRWFDVAARVAVRFGALHIVAEALHARGDALSARGLVSEACQAWACAGEAARRAGAAERERLAWQALLPFLTAANRLDDVANVERRMRDLAPHACGHEHTS